MGKRIYLLGLLLLAAFNIHAVTVKSTAGKLSTRIYNNYITDLTITGSKTWTCLTPPLPNTKALSKMAL